MDAIECIETRMSIRKFKDETVPKDLLMEVIQIAQRAPSYKNSQPWEVVIVSGMKKDALTSHLLDLLEKGEEAHPDIPVPEGWPEAIEKRIADNLEKRSKEFGINLSEPDNLKRSKIANYSFYGAPHAIFFFQDASLNEWSILDIGIFVQNVMLAAHAKGLGTVPQGFLIDYSQQIKTFLGIPEEKRLIIGMSIGYPDLSHRLNSYRTERIDVTEMTKWVK